MSNEGDARTQRELGALSAEVKHVTEELSEVRADVKAIRTVIDESRGGIRVMLAAASLGGAVTALLAELGIKTLIK